MNIKEINKEFDKRCHKEGLKATMEAIGRSDCPMCGANLDLEKSHNRIKDFIKNTVIKEVFKELIISKEKSRNAGMEKSDYLILHMFNEYIKKLAKDKYNIEF